MTDQLVPEGALPDGSAALRREVRAFLDEEAERGTALGRPDSWFSGWDRGFSQRLAARGWVGMTLPVEYGGGGRSALERYVVVEELLAAGAPVSAHWVSDRQAGPAILAHGTDEQRRRFLPAIAAGRSFFSIGMSEQGAGSDLAAVATRAVCDDDGTWRLHGTKLWTGGAHVNDHAIVLARSDDAGEGGRHAGLSQFIVDLRAPGVTVEPIRLLTGEHRFNAVHLDGAPAELLGARGAGWAQVTGELAHERSGPERFLSTFPLLCSFLSETEGENVDATTTARLGRLVARLAALRHLSIGVAGALERGESPDIAAALVKDLGTRFEGDVVEVVREGWNSLPDLDARPGSHGELLAVGITHPPGYTLRGGTNEILRGIVTRGIAPSTPSDTARRLAAHATDEVLSDPASFVDATWSVLTDVLPAPDAPLAEQVAFARAVGAHPAPGPFAEAAVVARPLLAAAGLPIPAGPVTAVHAPGLGYEPLADDGTVWLEGIARWWVSWGRGTIVLLTDDADGPLVALVEPAMADDDTAHEPRTAYADLRPGRTLAGEPRDLLTVHRYRATAARVSPTVATDALRRLDLARAAQIAGAAQQACDLAVAHVSEREQFGRPLAAFQAVKQDLARLVEEVALVSAAVDTAVTELGSDHPHDPDLALSVACVQADASITEITRIAHQLHGAVGFTELSPLRHATTRLWSWRNAWTGGSWDVWLGEAAREARWSGLWPIVTRTV